MYTTLLWITEAEECGPNDRYICGNKCHGMENTCKCGNQSWKGANYDQGCCPSSPDSCIKDESGKTISKTRQKSPIFHSSNFTGNVVCEQGEVLPLGEKCPLICQCVSSDSSYSRPICEDPKTSETFCTLAKLADMICRGIPNVGCKE